MCASRDTPDYHALVLLNMILGGQFVSRVNLNLRQDKGYTYGVRTGFDLRRGLGPFVLQTSVADRGDGAGDSRSRCASSTTSAARGPATADEIALARASVTRGYPRGFETAQQVARGVAQLALHGLPDTLLRGVRAARRSRHAGRCRAASRRSISIRRAWSRWPSAITIASRRRSATLEPGRADGPGV